MDLSWRAPHCARNVPYVGHTVRPIESPEGGLDGVPGRGLDWWYRWFILVVTTFPVILFTFSSSKAIHKKGCGLVLPQGETGVAIPLPANEPGLPITRFRGLETKHYDRLHTTATGTSDMSLLHQICCCSFRSWANYEAGDVCFSQGSIIVPRHSETRRQSLQFRD